MDDTLRKSRMQHLQAELDVLTACPSYRDWELLRDVHAAYVRNVDALIGHVQLPEQDPLLAVKLIDADPALDEKISFHQELLRHLLNYCASVSTLVDHTRNFMRRYSHTEPELVREYEIRRDKVVGLDVAHFVQGLRNYLLHYRVPSVTSTLSFAGPASISFAIRLDCTALSRWDRWKAPAKSYMAGKESIVLAEAVHAYTAAIQELYKWLFSLARDTVQKTAARKLTVQSEIAILSQAT